MSKIVSEHKVIDKKLTRVTLLFLLILSPFVGESQKDGKFTLPSGITSNAYAQDFIIVKLKNNDTKDLEEVVKLLKAKKAHTAIPNLNSQANYRRNKSGIDLSRIYRIELVPGQDALETINKLVELEIVEYAEPYYFIQPLQSPNDPGAQMNGAQYYLRNVKAHEAWQIEKGNPNIVVGVLDTGVDYEHEDLTANLYKNTGDPIDKFDNDGDGFIDNLTGWDFGDNDNDPMADKNPHGTQVAGVVAASPNNGLGIAGIGYHSKYMPIKVFRTKDNMFFGGYEAILYAAEKGCKVINLSWGSANAFSYYVQDIINYVVLEKDVVIVAAAGNTGTEAHFYPASYENVLSVGASDINDVKASWSTYSEYIDILAPGEAIYTTNNGHSYTTDRGTSFSAPMVAGAAALVRAKYPQMNALQVMEKLRMSTDDIYSIPQNAAFIGKLGRGRLNIEKALQELKLPSIKVAASSYENKFGPFAFFDDTISVKLRYINYLDDANNIRITLSSTSPYVSVLDSIYNLASINALQLVDQQSPFKVYLKPSLPASQVLKFKLKIENNDFVDYQFFEIVTSPPHLTLGNGALELTVASNGNLGKNNDYYYEGSGITYQSKQILEQVGLMMSAGTDKVMNNVIRNFDFTTRDRDFFNTEELKYYNDSQSPIDVRSSFQPVTNYDFPQINIDQKVLGWKSTSDKKFLIIEYRITNISGKDITNFNTGIFANWDINDKTANRALWDESKKLGYIFDGKTQNLYAGIALLTPQAPSYYAIDQKNFNGNSSTFGSEFSREKKIQSLSNGTINQQAGFNGDGNDVSHTVGAAIGTFKNNESIKISFAFVVGESLQDLQYQVTQALTRYTQYTENPPVLMTVATCTGETATIDPLGENFDFFEDINLTKLISSGTSLTTDPILEPKVIYATNLDKGFRGDVKQIKININETVPDFSMTADTIILAYGESKVVNFYDKSSSANKWLWSFNNGYKSTVKDPKIKFTTPGVYKVELSVSNQTGCNGSTSKTLVVIQAGPLPKVVDLNICYNEPAIIAAENTSLLKVYADSNLRDLLFEGETFNTNALTATRTYYVTNNEGAAESKAVPVRVTVNTLKASFDYFPDTTRLDKNNIIKLKNLTAGVQKVEWYVNGKFISNENEPSLEIDVLVAKEVKLVVWNENNCMDEISRTLEIKKSEKPIDQQIWVCKGSPTVIKPLEGRTFYFYDEIGGNIIHKGSVYVTGEINTAQVIYVTNADYIIESEPAKITVRPFNLSASFNVLTALNTSSFHKKIALKSTSENATTWQWDFGDGTIKSEENPFHTYSAPGIYTISLTVTNELGCSEKTEREVTITDEIEKGFEVISGRDFTIYPNPSTGEVKLNFQQIQDEKSRIMVTTSMGELVYSTWINSALTNFQLDLSTFASGIYQIHLVSSQGVFTQRLMISK